MAKKTLVIGASPNPERYSYKAVNRLLQHGHPVVAVGIKKGSINSIEIEAPGKIYHDIHTVTLYINLRHQREEGYYEYILQTNPHRLIFNPGTENPELAEILTSKGIRVEEACTLVLLATGQY